MELNQLNVMVDDLNTMVNDFLVQYFGSSELARDLAPFYTVEVLKGSSQTSSGTSSVEHDSNTKTKVVFQLSFIIRRKTMDEVIYERVKKSRNDAGKE